MPHEYDRDFDADIKNHYRFEAGQDSPYGKVNFRVLSNGGSSVSIHEDGINKENMQTAISGRSVEALGYSIERTRTSRQDPPVPAKWITCKHGDVLIECEDGDIIMKADNIIMEANGVMDAMDGDIQLNANKGIKIEAPDVRIVGSNLRFTARKDFSISGKVSGGIVAGVLNMAASADFGASIQLGLLKQIKNMLKAE
jgi:hypothetical protein|tara:strand:- start:399 stop:992 length:594 start_codon:yes stop_codon:yes gene_type:complete